MTKIRRMFPGGNTANGFYSFHDNIVDEDRNMLYILKGMPGGGKSSLMKEVGKRALEEGCTIEYHHCPSDPNSIDGILIHEFKIAIVDGTAPHIIDPVYPGLKDKIIDLGIFIDSDKLAKNKGKIIEARLNNKIAYNRAYKYFKSAKIVYNIIVENNKTAMDFQKVNNETKRLLDNIFSVNKGERKIIKLRHMFANANTPEGYVDFTHTLLGDCWNIYYIEGDIGTGKSSVMERIVEEGKIRGYDMEIYHNSTIPEKIESIIIRDFKTCITSNKKGLDFPHFKINLNNYFNPKIKNNRDYEIYNVLMEEATKNLALAKTNHKILEEAYKTSIDFSGVDKVKENIIREIF